MLGGTVRGKVVTLRLPIEADLVAHQRWAADLRVRRAGPIARWHEPASSATWKERFTEQAKEKTSVLWSVDAGDALVGYIRVDFDGHPPADHCGLTHFVIDPDRERRGYGWDAALALHRWAFDFMHFRMSSCLHLLADDVGRQRILERLGYRRFGHGHAAQYRDATYVDEYLYQMEFADWDTRWGATEREYEPLGAVARR